MKKPKPNGHERRTIARRSAWAAAAQALRFATLSMPPALADDMTAQALHWSTLRDVQRFLDRRARGILGAPPGGVGGGTERAR